MKRYAPIIMSLLILQGISAQDSLKYTGFDPAKGNPVIQVFGNFDYNATQGADKKYGFWFGRAHFGYEYQYNRYLSGKIVLDAGRPASTGTIEVTDSAGNHHEVSNTSREGSYYTMTLKFASIEWKPAANFKLQAGAVLQNHYITQEKFWGYRYVAETFQDRYFKMPSSDLGIIAFYSPVQDLHVDLAITNGEGFRSDQDPFGDVKVAAGIDFLPLKGLQSRFYTDYTRSDDPQKTGTQRSFSVFAGYRQPNQFRIGGEFNYRKNHQFNINRNLFGGSVFGSYCLLKNLEVFIRYDELSANYLDGGANNWYYDYTGRALITGIHYNPAEKISLSVNYQDWNPDNPDIHYQNHFLFSFEYKL